MNGEFFKKVSDLSRDELEQVWEQNKQIRERVWEWGMESAFDLIREYLADLPGRAADYSIGGQGDYFTVKAPDDFLDWLKDVQRDFCLLPENEEWDPWPLISKAVDLDNRMSYLYYETSAENYERMETRRDELVEELADEVLRVLSAEYEYYNSESNCLETFCSQLEWFCGEDFWVDDEYNLWEEYTVKKCYA